MSFDRKNDHSYARAGMNSLYESWLNTNKDNPQKWHTDAEPAWKSFVDCVKEDMDIGVKVYPLVYGPREATPADAQHIHRFSRGTYLLIYKPGYSFYALVDRRSVAAGRISNFDVRKIGTPADDTYQVTLSGSQNIYFRRFARGLVIVNPSPDSSYGLTWMRYPAGPHSGRTGPRHRSG